MKCPKCKDIDLEESDFDSRIGDCPKCNNSFTDKEYNKILKTMDGI